MTPNELPTPRSRVEDYLAVLVERTGATIPEGVPHSRVEAYLRYICEEGVSGLTNGYYYEGAFYKDAEHTELIEPKEGRAYLDVANLAIYIYQDGVYNDYLTDVKTAINQLKSLVEALSGIGKYLSDWDATTGLPETDPLTMPYTYGTGDYYIVSAIGTTNYKPNGASYDGTASTTEETDEVQPLDIYHYDGNQWTLLKLHIIFNGFVKKSEVESRTEVIEYLDGTTETVKPLYEAEG